MTPKQRQDRITSLQEEQRHESRKVREYGRLKRLAETKLAYVAEELHHLGAP